jgi:hypothetical protein
MAKSKTPKLKDLNGYLFLAVKGDNVELIYDDSSDNKIAIGAGIASILETDDELFNIFSAAFLTAIEGKEKYNSKKSNIVHKKPTKKDK